MRIELRWNDGEGRMRSGSFPDVASARLFGQGLADSVGDYQAYCVLPVDLEYAAPPIRAQVLEWARSGGSFIAEATSPALKAI